MVVAVTLTVMMWMAVRDVAAGEMTLGDLTMVNAYLLQLFIPLNALGFVCWKIRQLLVNIISGSLFCRRQAPVARAEAGLLARESG